MIKRYIKKVIGLSMVGAMMVSVAACGTRQAEVISDYGDGSENPEGESNETEIVDSKAEEEQENSNPDGVTNIGSWTENIPGGGIGFESISIKMDLKDYSKVKPDVITVDLEPFNMEYIKKMCDSIFDKNSVYVYDYDNKTKEVYDELIKYYSRVEVSDGETFVYVPDELLSDGGWAYQQSMNPTTLEELEDKIQSLKNLKEKAPEKIDNDYHYSGYSGTIDGEEYYMYFGNANYDEYISAPETSQYNGRIITIMRKNLKDAYAGDTLTSLFYDLPSDVNPEDYLNEDDSDFEMDSIVDYSPLYRKYQVATSAIISDQEGGTEEGQNAVLYSSTDVHETNEIIDESDAEYGKYIATAHEFLENIGFGDYKFSGELPDGLMWGNGVDEGFIYQTGINASPSMRRMVDGYAFKFTLDNIYLDQIKKTDIRISNYSDADDLLEFGSYIEVFINANGVLGCQIYNPASVKKVDPENDIIDTATVQEIVRDSISDKNKWNMPVGREVNLFDINYMKLISFPIRSTKDKNEYTYIPCYMVFNQLLDDTQTGVYHRTVAPSSSIDHPFILVNALDGNTIKIDDNLKDYPVGWTVKNCGFKNFEAGNIERMQRYSITKTSEEE